MDLLYIALQVVLFILICLLIIVQLSEFIPALRKICIKALYTVTPYARILYNVYMDIQNQFSPDTVYCIFGKSCRFPIEANQLPCEDYLALINKHFLKIIGESNKYTDATSFTIMLNDILAYNYREVKCNIELIISFMYNEKPAKLIFMIGPVEVFFNKELNEALSYKPFLQFLEEHFPKDETL